MKILLLSTVFVAATLAFVSESRSEADFLAFELPPEVKRFSLAEAQILADTKRFALHRCGGVSVFKEKRGAVWVFKTNIGYAGSPAPDILIVEPPITLPSFGAERTGANQALQPTPMLVTPRADARVAPSTGVADL